MTAPGPTRSQQLAGAPVSFGVWGPHHGPADGTPQQVLAALSEIGYSGAELGPPGYLGNPDQTGRRLQTARLRPAGVYVGLSLTATDEHQAGLSDLETVAASLSMARSLADRHQPGGPEPVLVIADDGAPALQFAPRDPADRGSGLDDSQWRHAIDILDEARAIAARHGLPIAVHPHLATWIESGWEIQRLLDTTGLALVLDTGHLLLAGVDPSAAVRRWRERIIHVHLKDVAPAVAAEARRHGPVPLRSWWDRACVRFGDGDVDLGDVVSHLLTTGYEGWLVNERDVAPAGGAELAWMAAEQQHDYNVLLTHLRDPEPSHRP